jgi:diguanylate cyclase (GGDEF)-like protein
MAQIELQDNRPSNDPRFLMRVMDGLTQVSNIQGLNPRLREEIEFSRGSHQGFGLVLFDIDSFTDFNEYWGHVAGDCLIAALAKQIQGRLQTTDFVARYAGEEFAVIVRRSSPQEVGEVAESLREAIARAEFRLAELLLPEARHTAPDQNSSPGATNENYQRGLQHLSANELAEAALSFQAAIEQDANHVPSIMELEFLKLRQTLDRDRLDEPFRITVSGGAAWYREGDTAESLLDRADQCLGLAKQSGRNQIRLEA